MPVVNDFPGLYEQIKTNADALAARLGLQKEVIYGFFNETGHFPQTIQELVNWGNQQTKYGVSRRDPTTGAWTPIMPGVNPDPRLTALDRGGFSHRITNAEDSDIERFQQVDPRGMMFQGSWDPAYNAAHPNQTGQSALTQTTQGTRSAQGTDANNYTGPVSPGDPNTRWVSVVNGVPNVYDTQPQALHDFGTRGGVQLEVASTATSSDTSGALPGAADRQAIVDANAYGNTETLRANIDKALRDYALARTQEQRNQAYLDLQRWQTELQKVETQQKAVSDMATALLSASTTLSNQPADYVKFNQAVSGGRDIMDRITGNAGPVAAFGGVTGQIQPGSVWDLLARLGMQYPATPETPAGELPGAANPSNPDLPAVNVPGTTTNPGALGEGAGSTGTGASGTATAASLPASYEQALRELDQAAGGQWGGNRADRKAVAAAWWAADPSRRSTAMPTASWA